MFACYLCLAFVLGMALMMVIMTAPSWCQRTTNAPLTYDEALLLWMRDSVTGDPTM